MYDSRRKFIINALYFALIAAIVYIIFKLAAKALIPFIIGFAAAAVVNPVLRFLSRKFDMRRRPAGIMLLLLFYATIGMLITVLSVRAAILIGELSGSLPEIYAERIEPLIGRCFEFINNIAERFDRVSGRSGELGADYDLSSFFSQIKSSLGTAVSELSVMVLTKLSGFAASIPGVIVDTVFAVISSFFFTVEFERILDFLKRTLPERLTRLLCEIRSRSFSAFGKYLRSYFLIMLITFAQLSLGLLIIGIESPFAIALAIALFDLLPILGTGGILLPWSAMSLLSGDGGLALGLLILWGVISLVRNILEPKIVGGQVGLHPLATLIAMFVGTKLFGIVGLFALPIALAVAQPFIAERFGIPTGESEN